LNGEYEYSQDTARLTPAGDGCEKNVSWKLVGTGEFVPDVHVSKRPDVRKAGGKHTTKSEDGLV